MTTSISALEAAQSRISAIDQVLGQGSPTYSAQSTTGSTERGNGVTTLTTDDSTSTLGLGKDGYFKLFITELQNQDPTSPMDSSEMVSQLAQFTMIETLSQLSDSLGAAKLPQAAGLIGRHITGTDTNGSSVDGTVSSVQQSGDMVLLCVGDQLVKPDKVATVTPVDTTSTGSTTGTETSTA